MTLILSATDWRLILNRLEVNDAVIVDFSNLDSWHGESLVLQLDYLLDVIGRAFA